MLHRQITLLPVRTLLGEQMTKHLHLMKGFPVNRERVVAFSLVYNLKFVQRLMNHVKYVAALTSLSRRSSSVPSVWLDLLIYCTHGGTSGSSNYDTVGAHDHFTRFIN